jgi:alpha-ketoglutarate-dependent taurine dioxygenase
LEWSIGNQHTRIQVLECEISPHDSEAWVGQAQNHISKQLQLNGAVLLRGLGINSVSDFERTIRVLIPVSKPYTEGATPRTEITARVSTSTEFPSEHPIAIHNELSYTLSWPDRIAFCCLQAPAIGGETPVADVREVLAILPSEIVGKFASKQWMLTRNYGTGLGPTWQKAFRTDNVEELKEHCANEEVSVEFLSKDRIRTRQIRPTVRTHPTTGDKVWFNHVAFWHESSLPEKVRQGLRSQFGGSGLPYATHFGDGGSISREDVRIIRDAYEQATVRFNWKQGDVLLLDNMLIGHGRQPFVGKRQIVVSMGCQPRRGVSVSAHGT